MPLNIGIGGPPPRKKAGVPPRVGHMLIIATAPKGKGPPPKDGGGPNLGGDGPPLGRGVRNPVPSGPTRPLPPARALPEQEADAGGTDQHKILPEAVSYRSEQETCGNCVHMQEDGECARLLIPVSHGDGCNLFSDRSSGEDADEAAERFEPEEEEENEPLPA